MMKSDSETKAFSAFNTFSVDDITKVVKVAKATLKSEAFAQEKNNNELKTDQKAIVSPI